LACNTQPASCWSRNCCESFGSNSQQFENLHKLLKTPGSLPLIRQDMNSTLGKMDWLFWEKASTPKPKLLWQLRMRYAFLSPRAGTGTVNIAPRHRCAS